MSGRGTGGGLVIGHKPEEVQVTLNLRTTTSDPTFFLDNDLPEIPFYIQIHASVKYSTHPTLPVTLSTFKTPLERAKRDKGEEEEEEEGKLSKSPVWINSALTSLRSTTDPSRHVEPPALSHIACGRGGLSRNIRESWDFITIPPAAGQGTPEEEKREVMVQHLLPRDGLTFFHVDRSKGEMRPKKGEKFAVGPSARALGTYWWTWGDLNGDLADKKFWANEWWDEDRDGNKDSDEDPVVGNGWVKSEGENGFGLTVEVENYAEVEFV